jgi:hypothetical protein
MFYGGHHQRCRGGQCRYCRQRGRGGQCRHRRVGGGRGQCAHRIRGRRRRLRPVGGLRALSMVRRLLGLRRLRRVRGLCRLHGLHRLCWAARCGWGDGSRRDEGNGRGPLGPVGRGSPAPPDKCRLRPPASSNRRAQLEHVSSPLSVTGSDPAVTELGEHAGQLRLPVAAVGAAAEVVAGAPSGAGSRAPVRLLAEEGCHFGACPDGRA